jgi:MinD-like ATPase involved in chromosome partitioning or flagellar assembly
VPSDRDIPKAVNQGQAIVQAKPRSDVAKAYRRLAGMYETTPTRKASRRRLRLRRATREG